MNLIRLVRHEESCATTVVPDRYELNPSGWFPLMQKLLFAILRRLGANSFVQSVTYTTTEIDTGKILDAVMRNQADAERLYFKRAKYVVMGPREFAQFSSTSGKDLYPQFMQFSFDARLGYGQTVTVFGLECVVVPWIEGFFVMPDLQTQ